MLRTSVGGWLRPRTLLRGGLGGHHGGLALTQTSGLALALPQVEQAGPAHTTGAHHLDLLEDRRVHGENSLHARAVRHLANRKRSIGTTAAQGDHDAFEHLNTFLFAFFDADVHADG